MEGLPIIEWLSTYGYLVLIPLLFIDANVVGIAAGALASVGAFNPFLVGIAFIVVDSCKDTILWTIGHRGGRGMSRFKTGRKIMNIVIDKNEGPAKEGISFFERNFEYIFMSIKMIPIIPHFGLFSLLLSGFIGVTRKRLWRVLAGIQPLKAAMMVGFGYFFGASVQDVGLLIEIGGIVILASFGITYIYFKFLHKHLIDKPGFKYLTDLQK